MGNWGWRDGRSIGCLWCPNNLSVCGLIDDGAAAGCRDTALDAYNGNDGSGILAASLSHTHFLSKMEMGRYFLLDFSKLAPLFGAFRVIRALFCCLSTRECVVPPRSSSSVIFGVDNDTAGSAERARRALYLQHFLPPHLKFFCFI